MNSKVISQLYIFLVFGFLVSCGGGNSSVPDKPAPKPQQPSVVKIFPTEGDIALSTTPIIITFSHDMNAESFNDQSFTITDSNSNPVAMTFDFPSADSVAFRHTELLIPLEKYNLSLTGVKNSEGVELPLFTSFFNVIKGSWTVKIQPVIVPRSGSYFENTYNIASTKNAVYLQWNEVTPVSDRETTVYTQSYIKSWGQKTVLFKTALDKTAGTGSLVTDINLVAFESGQLSLVGTRGFSGVDSTYASVYNGAWEVPRIISLNAAPKVLASSLNGQAVVVLREPSSYAIASRSTGWTPQTLEKTSTKIAIKNAYETHVTPVIYNDESGLVFYRKSHVTEKFQTEYNYYVLETPFETSIETKLSLRDSTVDINHPIVLDVYDSGILLLMKYLDNTFWTIEKTASGWGTAKKIITIPTTATVITVVKLINNRELIVFTDGDQIKSTLLDGTWQPSEIVSTRPNISDFNRYDHGPTGIAVKNEVVTIAWFTENGLYSNQYKNGWLGESIIDAYPDKTNYLTLAAPKLIATDTAIHVFWSNRKTGKYNLYTALLR